MGRIGRGFSMMKQSFALLRKDKELMVLPLLSGVAIAIVVASFFFGMGLHKEGADVERLEGTAGVVTAFVLYVITYTVAFFFQAALVAGASERLRGGDPTVGSALGAASKRFLPIVMWAIVAATVGMILRAIQDKSELLGKIVAGIAGMSWPAIAVRPAMVAGITPARAIQDSRGSGDRMRIAKPAANHADRSRAAHTSPRRTGSVSLPVSRSAAMSGIEFTHKMAATKQAITAPSHQASTGIAPVKMSIVPATGRMPNATPITRSPSPRHARHGGEE